MEGVELGDRREEGVVLGLSVSGACGNSASPKLHRRSEFTEYFYSAFPFFLFSASASSRGIKRL